MKQRKNTGLSQSTFNGLNFGVAMVALLISIPSAIYQVSQLRKDAVRDRRTEVVYYSPPANLKLEDAIGNDTSCWESIASLRRDAYRCSTGNLLQDPCFEFQQYKDWESLYAYCPSAVEPQNDDVFLKTDRPAPLTSTALPEEVQKSAKKSEVQLPWLFKLGENVKCRLNTGAVDRAYDDEGQLFGCSGDTYSVVSGAISTVNDQYFVRCKKSSSTTFELCYINTIVY